MPPAGSRLCQLDTNAIPADTNAIYRAFRLSTSMKSVVFMIVIASSGGRASFPHGWHCPEVASTKKVSYSWLYQFGG